MSSVPSPSQGRSLEKFLSALSAAFSLTITVRLWMLVAGQQHRLSTSAGLLVGAALLQGVIVFAIIELQS